MFAKKCHHHVAFGTFSNFGIFPTYFGCFGPADKADKNYVELRKIYQAISLQYSKPQCSRFVTGTCSLRERDRDSRKWVSRRASRRDHVSRFQHW